MPCHRCDTAVNTPVQRYIYTLIPCRWSINAFVFQAVQTSKFELVAGLSYFVWAIVFKISTAGGPFVFHSSKVVTADFFVFVFKNQGGLQEVAPQVSACTHSSQLHGESAPW